jgi:hypothetical protein
METNVANNGQNKLYLFLCFFDHSRTAMFCTTAGLKIVLVYAQILTLQVLSTSLTDLRVVKTVLK